MYNILCNLKIKIKFVNKRNDDDTRKTIKSDLIIFDFKEIKSFILVSHKDEKLKQYFR